MKKVLRLVSITSILIVVVRHPYLMKKVLRLYQSVRYAFTSVRHPYLMKKVLRLGIRDRSAKV